MLLFIFRLSSSPNPDDIMKENQEYIRKRRPVNFTLADLEEEDEEFDYQNFDPMPSTSRALPSRICKKKILYDDKSSSDEEPDEDVAAEEPNFSDGKNYNPNEEKVDSQNDEKVLLQSTHLKINELLSEFNTLTTKFESEMKRHCKESTRYFEEKQEWIQQRMTNPSADENEKFLILVDRFLQELKKFLVIRGISVRNQNSLPSL